MSTAWQSQRSRGHYSLQFETDDEQKYKLVEKAAQMAIDGKPITDTEEVRHGEWDYIATHDCFSCSICKFDSDVVMKYCGGCGAKMDGGKKKND